VSSLTENDAFFTMLLRRLWIGGVDPSSPARGGRSPSAAFGGEAPMSPGGQASPSASRRPAQLGGRRPPAHAGPSAYATAEPHVDQQHRRFMRKELPGAIEPNSNGGPREAWQTSGPMNGHSPITKSSIVFNEEASSELGAVFRKMRQSMAVRGLKMWKSLAEKFGSYDNRKNGGIMRMDFERLHKSLGLGLAHEERDVLFKTLSHGRKDGSMDYRECLRRLKVPLNDQQQVWIEELFHSMEDAGSASSEELKARFDPRNSPCCVLARKDSKQVAQEFYDAVDVFCGGGSLLDIEAFSDFFMIIAAIHSEGDEFHLMTTAGFGLQH